MKVQQRFWCVIWTHTRCVSQSVQGCVLSSNDNINHIWLGRWNIHVRPSPISWTTKNSAPLFFFSTTHRCMYVVYCENPFSTQLSFTWYSCTNSHNPTMNSSLPFFSISCCAFAFTDPASSHVSSSTSFLSCSFSSQKHSVPQSIQP